MKRTQEILGLPIISISDGMEVGKVKSIIINADKGAIDYIVVDSGIQILSARVIPTDNILGVGEYALTIESDVSINDISKIPAAIDLLQKNIQVKGTKVLTKKGRLIGEIGDVYVDENDNFKIVGLEYIADITQKRIRLIPRDSVITFGKNLVVVKDNVEDTLLDRATQLSPIDKTIETEKKNMVINEYTAPVAAESSITEADRIIASEGNNYFKEINTPSYTETESVPESVNEIGGFAGYEPVEETFSPVETQAPQEMTETIEDTADMGANVQTPATSQTSAADLFEQRQKQYLKGRRATKTITDNSGNVIINEGMVISEDIIDVAKQTGKLIELVMNNKA